MLTKTYRFRLIVPILGSLAAYLIVGWRLYDLQVRQHEPYATRAVHQQHKTVQLTPRRGDVLDRNGATLATSYFSDTIIIDTRKIKDPAPELIDDLALVIRKAPVPLEVETTTDTQQPTPTRMSEARAREAVEAMFAKPRRHILYRKAPEEVSQMMSFVEDAHRLPPGCVVYEKHSKRFYPNHVLGSHVLGYTKIDDSGDNVGMSGIEETYDKDLKGSYRKAQIQINSAQHSLAPIDEEEVAATFGNTVVLTLDKTIQLFAERALRAQVGRYQAKGGIVVVMDVTNGEVLAMASCPDFNPNEFTKADPLQRKNRVLTDPIEIGSVMKIITATLLIDQGLLSPDEIIDCHGGWTSFGGRIIKDTHPLGAVPFRTAFAESSNVGLVTVGLRLEPEIYYEGLTRFGLGRAVGIDLGGEGNGVLYPVSKWSSLSRTSLPMGYETSLTPVQVISALGAIGNKGVRMRPHLVREVRTPRGDLLRKVEPQPLDQVASPQTCATILELMEGVVTEGTGDKAAVPGYRIGGKTGTSVKYGGNKDPGTRRYYASFAGLFPIDNPRLAIYAYVDEPHGAKYGGTVAAPIFREVALAAAHILGIPPNDPVAFNEARAKGMHPMDAPLTSGTLLHDYLTSLTTPVSEEAVLNVAALNREALARGRDSAGTPDSAEAATDEALQAAADAATSASLPLGPDELWAPDLRGLTIRAAYEQAAALGLDVRALGSGVAQRQDPAPQTRMPRGGSLTITFAHPSQALPDAQPAAAPAGQPPAKQPTAPAAGRAKQPRAELPRAVLPRARAQAGADQGAATEQSDDDDPPAAVSIDALDDTDSSAQDAAAADDSAEPLAE